MVSKLHLENGSFRPPKRALTETDVARPWHEYREGLAYLRGVPLLFAISLVHVGWATGGGAAQILFSLFGEIVFNRGAMGIGLIWSAAGVGLLVGAAVAHRMGETIPFEKYKTTIWICYLIHGAAYVLFSQAQSFRAALGFIALSRASVAVTSVLNQMQLLRHIPDNYRGRVFSTIESMTWATMMLSLTAAGVASESYSPRTIGVWAGAVSGLTAIGWLWANWRNALPQPAAIGIDPDDLEVRAQPRM